VEDSKSAYRSKLNWIGAFMMVLGLYSDPVFKDYLGGVIPEAWLSRVMSGLGLAVMILRTFFTNLPITK